MRLGGPVAAAVAVRQLRRGYGRSGAGGASRRPWRTAGAIRHPVDEPQAVGHLEGCREGPDVVPIASADGSPGPRSVDGSAPVPSEVLMAGDVTFLAPPGAVTHHLLQAPLREVHQVPRPEDAG